MKGVFSFPMERRRHRRVHAQLKSWLRANSHEIEGETIDLSAGGAKFASSLPVELGKQVTVRLYIPGTDTPIDIEQAQVQWIHDQTFGVRFLEIRQQELDELEQLIDEYIALDEGGQA
ncbi:MAG TPA: PilZ domain-containing protein [Nitrospira sp.]|nr:PilZ domain-containing protein [Nitrospira sp.]